MKKVLVLGIISSAVLFGISSFANDITLKPGSKVTIYDAPAEVTCEHEGVPFQRFCKCYQSGFSQEFALELVVDRDGTAEDLGAFDKQMDCYQALSLNPACKK